MDTSKEYINQCEKALEIQALKPCGNPEYWSYGDIFSDGVNVFVCTPAHFPVSGLIFLPRQDQLQEMMIPKDEQDCLNKYVVLLDDFQEWVLEKGIGLEWSYLIQVSMEQLWLAYVMHEKYQKIWANGEWIKEE